MGKDTVIEESLLDEITAFCKLNEEDTVKFINKLLKSAYLEVKYSDILINKGKAEKAPTEEPKEEKNKEENITEPEKNFFTGGKKRDLYGE